MKSRIFHRQGVRWVRVSADLPCQICGKTSWCLVAPDGTAAICPRTPSSRPIGEAGYLHRLDGSLRRPPLPRESQSPEPSVDLSKLAGVCCRALGDDGRQALANLLGVSVESLHALRAGWSTAHRSYSFPMTDANGNVRGIRLRALNGRKFAVRGGHEGLFIPADLAIDHRLFIVEGPSDVCAGLDLGLPIIGRPSCSGGVRPIVELVQNCKPREAVVVADADQPGKDGAERLAKTLLDRTQAAVRVVCPPEGLKDLRDWKASGAKREDVMAVVGRAELRRPVPLSIRKANEHALEHRARMPR